MESRAEDAMDLGGFLHSYVLSNPFTQTLVTTETAVGAEETDSVSRDSTQKVDGNHNNKTCRLRPRTEISHLISKTPGNIVTVIKSPSNTSIATDDLLLGHIGSNQSYAENLRENKVSHAHKPIQEWLRVHFQHCNPSHPQHQHLFNSADLLSEAQKHFPSLTSVILSRIISFTFPRCRKVINKQGTYWQGLYYSQQQSELDTVDAPRCSETPKSCRKSLSRLRTRSKSQNLSGLDLLNSSMISQKENDANNKEQPEHMSKPDNSVDTYQASKVQSVISSGKTLSRKRKKSRPQRRKRSISSEVTDGADDHVTENGEDVTENDDHVTENGDHVTLNDDHLTVNNDYECEKKLKLDVNVVTSVSPLSSSIQISEVKVKSEPFDSECSTAGFYANHSSFKQKGDRQLKKEVEDISVAGDSLCNQREVDHLTASTHVSPGASSQLSRFLKCVIQNKKLLREKDELKQNLSSVQQRNVELESDLERSQSEVRLLTQQLSDKDRKLTELCQEFVELNTRFYMLSERFQSVLQGAVSNKTTMK